MAVHDGKFLHLPIVDKDGVAVAVVDVLHITHAAIATLNIQQEPSRINSYRREGYNETETMQLLSQTHIQSPSSLRPGQFVNESENSMLHMFSPSSNYQVQYPSSSSNGGQIGATTGGNHLSLSMSNNQQRPFINPPQLFATAATSSGFPQQITTRPQNWLHQKNGFYSLMRPS